MVITAVRIPRLHLLTLLPGPLSSSLSLSRRKMFVLLLNEPINYSLDSHIIYKIQ